MEWTKGWLVICLVMFLSNSSTPSFLSSFAGTVWMCRNWWSNHKDIWLLWVTSMFWHRQAIFESKGDKLSSSAKCRIRTQGLRHQIASRLNTRWQTDWAIEDQAKKLELDCWWFQANFMRPNPLTNFCNAVKLPNATLKPVKPRPSWCCWSVIRKPLSKSFEQ